MTISGNRMASGEKASSPAERLLCRTFSGEPGQVAMMRKFVWRCLAGCRVPRSSMDDILVCATELATNAVLHSHSGKPGGYFTVEIAIRTGHSVYVAVKDSGGVWADPGAGGFDDVGDFEAEGGRGLRVVATLSADMGITGSASGRTAWFRIPWPPSPACR